ncbi:MAG: pyridoxal-phosphate dependent enzyme, partial [Clostridia bacterium]|nr:pyridoxal-phosphate dependent enzyme [Clostridia bacterium]
MTIPHTTTPLYLHQQLPGGNQVYLKREDLLPYSFGGNKARIGFCYLEDMQKKGCNHMLAYGNARSNLCRVLSNLCAAHGFRLTILSPADDDGQQRPSMNGALCRQLGAEIIPCLKTGVAESVDAAMEAIRAAGDIPYYIYGDRTGQGNRHVPVAAYASQYAPLMEQCKAQMGAVPDVICLATGTGMTQAGLLCGQSVYDHGQAAVPQIIGMSVA